MRIITIFLLCCLSMFAQIAVAITPPQILVNDSEKMIIKIDGSYRLGDSDSLISARQVLGEQLKAEASNIFGVNVKSEFEIKNGKITKDVISTYSNSFLSYEVLNESMSINGVRQVLTTEAKVTVNKKHFFNNLNRLKDSNRLKDLAKKNAELTEKLKKLNQQIAANSVNPKIYEGRKDVLKQLDRNQRKFKKFVNTSDVKKQLLTNQHELEQYREDIRIGVLKYIIDNAEIEISDPVIKSSKENNVILSFHLNYQVPPKQIKSKLNKYYDKYSIREFKAGDEIQNRKRISYWNSLCIYTCKSDNSKTIEFSSISKKIKSLPYFDEIKKELGIYPELVFKLDGVNKSKTLPLSATNIVSDFYLYSSSLDLDFTIHKDEIDFVDGLSFEFQLVKKVRNKYKTINMEEYFDI